MSLIKKENLDEEPHLIDTLHSNFGSKHKVEVNLMFSIEATIEDLGVVPLPMDTEKLPGIPSIAFTKAARAQPMVVGMFDALGIVLPMSTPKIQLHQFR